MNISRYAMVLMAFGALAQVQAYEGEYEVTQTTEEEEELENTVVAEATPMTKCQLRRRALCLSGAAFLATGSAVALTLGISSPLMILALPFALPTAIAVRVGCKNLAPDFINRGLTGGGLSEENAAVIKSNISLGIIASIVAVCIGGINALMSCTLAVIPLAIITMFECLLRNYTSESMQGFSSHYFDNVQDRAIMESTIIGAILYSVVATVGIVSGASYSGPAVAVPANAIAA